ncbi:hypothetical protein [Streptomyces sp. NPDC003036]|uniref:hypothetical protein n=1 Tax=Streptomyces sp. NPDC003036 TaxID=3154442 RepID=UPI0033AE9B45
MFQAPTPINDGLVLLATQSRTGNAVLPLGKLRAGRLAIQINCRGHGTLTVTVEPVDLSFSLECADAKTSSGYNEMHLDAARPEGSIHIAGPPAVRWGATVEQ